MKRVKQSRLRGVKETFIYSLGAFLIIWRDLSVRCVEDMNAFENSQIILTLFINTITCCVTFNE